METMKADCLDAEFGLTGQGWTDGSIPSSSKVNSACTASQKVALLMDAIKQIQTTKKYLQMNSVEVKASIHSNISRLLESLRSREVWLFNQTDVLYQAKEEVLQAQEDRLNQALGALTNCLRLVECGAAIESDLIENLDRICQLETRPKETPHLMFRANAISLRDSIQRFGKVDTKGLPENVFHYGVSASSDETVTACSLPRQFEDYGDDEHQVLYKAIDPRQDSNEGPRIVFNVPKLPDTIDNNVNSSRGAGAGGARHCSSAPRLNEEKHRMTTGSFGDPAGSTNSASLRGTKASTLQYYIDQEKKISRSTSNSIRQWLSELYGEENDEDGLLPTESTIAEFTTRRSSVVDSEAPVVSSSTQSTSGCAGLDTGGPLRRITERPLSYWTASKTAEKLSDADLWKPAETLLKSAILKILNSPDTCWLRPSPTITSSNSIAGTEVKAPASYKCFFRTLPVNSDQRIVTTSTDASKDIKTPSYKCHFRLFSGEKVAPSGEPTEANGGLKRGGTSPIAGYLKRVHSYPDAHWLKSARRSSLATTDNATSTRLAGFLHPNSKVPSVIQFQFSSPDQAPETQFSNKTSTTAQFHLSSSHRASAEAMQVKPAKMVFKSYASRENMMESDKGNVEEVEMHAAKKESLDNQTTSDSLFCSSTESTTALSHTPACGNNVSREKVATCNDTSPSCANVIKKISLRPDSDWLATTLLKEVDNSEIFHEKSADGSCGKVRWIIGTNAGSAAAQESVLVSADSIEKPDDCVQSESSFGPVDQQDWVHCS